MPLHIDCLDRSRFKGEKSSLGLFAWENERLNTEGWLDARKEKTLEEIARREHFKAKTAELLVHYPEKEEPATRLLLAGLGKKKEVRLENLREATGKIIKNSLKQTETLGLDLPHWPDKAPLSALAQAAAEGALLAQYKYVKHKSSEDSKKDAVLERVVLVVEKPDETAAVQTGIRKGSICAEAVNFIRDLVNEPPSMKRPADLAKIARNLGSSRVRVRIYTKTDLARMGMNAILGVNAGSSHDPVFVHLQYKPKGAPKKKIGLVGKGITFDSGGLNIKVGAGMTTMKMDMAGGATVLGAIRACERLEIPHEVHGFIPFTENMPGPNAYKPGDVIRAYNGKTIEILNTDAEGRVVLSDALAFASKQNLDSIIDIATLTGAAVVALGDSYSALLGNNEKLIQDLLSASRSAGERVWQLPLAQEYKERIRGKFGDFANISVRGLGSEPGTIIGGLFLEEFVDSKPWAHFDIAGTAWTEAETSLCAPGGTGAIVRTLIEYLQSA